MSDDSSESAETVELTCPECATTWHQSEEDEDATCPDCETITPMEEMGP